MAKRYHNAIQTNNRGRGAMVKEDSSKPCFLPSGAFMREIESAGSIQYEDRGVPDLFMASNDMMKSDASAMRGLTKPKKY